MPREKKQTILIVDDQMINREILKNILSAEYNTVEAVNGLEAIKILEDGKEKITGILLDVMMPVMDGYGFMNEIRNTPYADLPVIVLTGSTGAESENRALNMGAWDFISKPYHPAILQSRLKNAIARSQMGAFDRIKHAAEFDALTGLHNRTKFFSETKEMLDEHPDTEFVMIRLDVDHFSLLNSFWGEKNGNTFLRYMGNSIEKACENFPLYAYGRITADIFCACIPNGKEETDHFVEETREQIMSYNSDYFVKPTYGIYVINDRSVSVENMYDCASMAAKTCKGKYNSYIGYYDKKMHEASFREQEIINEMQSALDSGQFVPYFQPKYNLQTNEPYGAEALVRWIHPEKGMISPGEFIPIFERNGFIGKLDYFMWDTVCGLLRKWTDSGINPAPVSVNISRADMYNPNIVKILTDLVKSHGIPMSLLNLELTESAYMDNPDIMKGIVHDLQKQGFTVMMDDFGSGYSSLNTLKDIPVNILKIDMNFLKGDDASGRSERILSSMIRMAGWLDLPVIVEGVETEHQCEFLRNIGCGYVQGYYFSRPLPLEKYEKLICDKHQEKTEEQISALSGTLNELIWSPDPQSEFLLNQIEQPLVVYEYSGGEYNPLRVNDSYNRTFGYGYNILNSCENTGSAVPDVNAAEIEKAFEEISEEHKTCSFLCGLKGQTEKDTKVRIVLNYLGNMGNSKVILAIILSENAEQRI